MGSAVASAHASGSLLRSLGGGLLLSVFGLRRSSNDSLLLLEGGGDYSDGDAYTKINW